MGNEEGQRHGQGRFEYTDGGVYDGSWVDGNMQGFGKLFYPSNKLAYEGHWANNVFNGNGTVYNEHPDTMEGPFDYANFDNSDEFWVKYSGEFVNDERSGVGSLIFQNGEKYVGSFKE